MKLVFSPLASKQWAEWNRVSPATAKRIKRLLQDILEHPYSGIGKPEPLKFGNGRITIAFGVSEFFL